MGAKPRAEGQSVERSLQIANTKPTDVLYEE